VAAEAKANPRKLSLRATARRAAGFSNEWYFLLPR
jgi:hypothetical protein